MRAKQVKLFVRKMLFNHKKNNSKFSSKLVISISSFQKTVCNVRIVKPYFAPCHSKNLHIFYQSSWGITKIIKKIFLVTGNERVKHINPFLARAPILYPLKTPENQIIFGVFRGYKIWILARNGLNSLTPVYHILQN